MQYKNKPAVAGWKKKQQPKCIWGFWHVAFFFLEDFLPQNLSLFFVADSASCSIFHNPPILWGFLLCRVVAPLQAEAGTDYKFSFCIKQEDMKLNKSFSFFQWHERITRLHLGADTSRGSIVKELFWNMGIKWCYCQNKSILPWLPRLHFTFAYWCCSAEVDGGIQTFIQTQWQPFLLFQGDHWSGQHLKYVQTWMTSKPDLLFLFCGALGLLHLSRAWRRWSEAPHNSFNSFTVSSFYSFCFVFFSDHFTSGLVLLSPGVIQSRNNYSDLIYQIFSFIYPAFTLIVFERLGVCHFNV